MISRMLFPFGWVVSLTMLFTAYSGHFENPFHFDDDHTIVSNTAIRDLDNIPGFFTDATTTSSLPANQAYRPWLTALNAMDYALQQKMKDCVKKDTGSFSAAFEKTFAPKWSKLPASAREQQINPFYFHLHIFGGFLVLGILIFLFMKRVFDLAIPHRGNRWAALAGTTLFWVHTANAETINYIISRSDSNSTTAMLAALVFFLYLRKPWNFLCAIPFFMLALFIKEPVIMLVVLVPVFQYFFVQDGSLPSLVEKRGAGVLRSLFPALPFLVVGLFFIYLSGKYTPEHWNPGGAGTWEYLGVQPYVMAHYVGNFFVPMSLSADTDWTAVYSFKDVRIYSGIACVFLLVYLAWHFSTERVTRPISFGILWFLLTLLPTSSVIPLAEVMNDHRPFMPYIGLTLALTWFLTLILIKSGKRIRSLLILCCAGLLCLHVYGTRARCEVWSSAENLWRDVSEKSPNNGRGLMNYGNALMARGDLQTAWEQYKKAEKLTPNYSYLLINMGVLKGYSGSPTEAEEYFKRALNADAGNPECYFYYAQFLSMQNRIDEAVRFNKEGLKLSPAHTYLLQQEEQLFIMQRIQTDSRLDKAIKDASNHPGADNFLLLSYEFYMAGKYEQSIKAAEEALKYDPKSDRAWNNICSGNNALKQWAKAVEAGKKALALNPENVVAKNNLKLALDSLGQK